MSSYIICNYCYSVILSSRLEKHLRTIKCIKSKKISEYKIKCDRELLEKGNEYIIQLNTYQKEITLLQAKIKLSIA